MWRNRPLGSMKAMADATTQFFSDLEERGHDARLAKLRGSMRLDLTNGSKRTRWLVTIDRGDVTVSHRNAKADCVIRADQAVFDRIASGELNAFAAVLRGLMQADGDAEMLVFFQRLFPAPGKHAA